MDTRDDERFVWIERRQNSREPAREHRLARPRRTDQQQMMRAGRRDLECAARHRLAAHIRQILDRTSR